MNLLMQLLPQVKQVHQGPTKRRRRHRERQTVEAKRAQDRNLVEQLRTKRQEQGARMTAERIALIERAASLPTGIRILGQEGAEP